MPEIFDNILNYIRDHRIEIMSDAVIGAFGAMLLFFWTRLKSIIMVRADLHPYHTKKEMRFAARYYIGTRIERLTFTEASDANLQPLSGKHLIPYFIKRAFQESDENQQYYLILADSGMGKTHFLINLYVQYTNKIFGKRNKIEMMSLWHPKTWDRLLAYPEDKAKETFLLLDALDEDPKAIADVQTRLNEIVDRTWMFRKVIISASPELFKDEMHEPSEIKIPDPGSPTGFRNFLKIYLAPFSQTDILQYVKKRYSFFRFRKIKAATDLIGKSNLLMKHPLLLSYIDDLVATRKKFVFAYEVYESLINKWIAREASHAAVSGKASLEYKNQLWLLSKAFACKVFTKYENMDVAGKEGFYLSDAEVADLVKSKSPSVDISIFRTKSLITRNQTGLIKFTHFSVFEFFLAHAAIEGESGLNEDKLKKFSNALLFYKETFWNRKVIPFFAQAGGKVFTKMGSMDVDIATILANGTLDRVDNLFVSGMKSLSLMLLTPLKNILTLQVINSPIESMESVASLRKIQTLNFENCSVSDVTPLKYLTDIRHLCLKDGSIQEIESMANLSNLEILNLENNKVTDLSPLANLRKLRRLNLVKNNITDLSPLRSLENLSWLFIAGNPVSQLEIDMLKNALPDCSVDTTKDRVYV